MIKKIIAISAVGFFMFAIAITPALAATIVVNSNSAFVGNHVSAGANTGGNYAGGADGGDGGDGGDIKNRGDDVINSSTGRGGNGGDAGVNSGGVVQTGNAGATAGVVNVVNTNDTTIDNCGCEPEEENGDGHEFTMVKNRNRAIVLNGVSAGANTGDNKAKGADGGEGGDGGDIKNKDGEEDGDVINSHTGAGGNGGASGEGGLVFTGHAGSTAGAINIVNRNVTRIRR